MPESARAIRTRVARTVQRLRHLRGLSQATLAERIEQSVKQIGEIESARANVGLNTLARLAAALSVDIVELFVHPAKRSPDAAALITREEADRVIDLGNRLKRTRAPRSKRSGG